MSAFLERTTGFEPATPTLTFPIALPRWGSRVRLPSSAPKKRTSTCAFTSNAVSTLSPLPMSCPWLAHDGPTVPGHGTRFDAERGPSVARGGPGHGIGRQPTAARAGALAGAGGIAWWRGDVPAARAAYEEALAIEQELGDPARIAEALYNLAFPVAGRDNMQAVRGLLEESLELFRAVGNESGAARALEIGQATRRVRKRDHAALYSC